MRFTSLPRIASLVRRIVNAVGVLTVMLVNSVTCVESVTDWILAYCPVSKWTSLSRSALEKVAALAVRVVPLAVAVAVGLIVDGARPPWEPLQGADRQLRHLRHLGHAC